MCNITVIGAGIYGSLISLKLSEMGYKVALYEKDKIMGGATKYNMWRLHNAYLYPGKKCMEKTKESYDDFKRLFPSVITNTKTYYAISNESKCSTEEYLSYLNENCLPYKQTELNVLHEETLQNINNKPSVFEVNEATYDPVELQRILTEMIKKDVNIKLFNMEYMIMGAPSNICVNTVPDTETKTFEIIYGYLPEKYRDMCIVIIDGPFMTINTYSNTGMHGIYHVEQSKTEVPESLINKEIAKSEYTKCDIIVRECKKYFKDFEFEYVGSTFTKKLTNPACKDCRHGYVKRVDNLINCYPGKVGEALKASDAVLSKIEKILSGI